MTTEQDDGINEKGTDYPVVFMEFTDAYSFRCLIEYLNLTNDEGNFIFTPAGFSYCQENDTGQILNEVKIFAHELTAYEFYPLVDDEERFVAGVNLTQLKSASKKIGKKDIARVYVHERTIQLQILGSPKNSSDSNRDFIRLKELEKIVLSISGYQDETEPNCTIGLQKFSAACADLSDCKEDYITIIGVENGLIMEGKQSGNLRSNIKCLGGIENDKDKYDVATETVKKIAGRTTRLSKKHADEIVRHRLTRRMITALGKLNNVSPNSAVKCYFQPDMPIKLGIHISSYGVLNIYLRTSQQRSNN